MDNSLKEILLDIENLKNIELEDIPKIDLYMDQVLTIFENILHTEEDKKEGNKTLTKTMINNYAKDKLLPSIKNKKYTLSHIILLAFIYNLKQGLPISSIKSLLEDQIENNNEEELKNLYSKYLEASKENIKKFSTEEKVNIDKIEINKEELMIYAMSLIHTSNLYKIFAEKIVEQYFTN